MFKGGGDMTKINSHPTQQKEAQLLDVVTHFYVKKIFRGETNFNGSPSYSHSCNVLYKVQKYWTKNSPVDHSTIDILSPWFSFDMVQTSQTHTEKKVSNMHPIIIVMAVCLTV